MVFAFDGARDVFVRRIANVKKENGERAVGTVLAADHLAQAKLRRDEAYAGPADRFGRRMDEVRDRARSLAERAATMSDLSRRAETGVGSASSGFHDTALHVQAVASAAEEPTASIAEISVRIDAARSEVEGAVGEARATDSGIRELAGSVQRIGDVVGLIRAIAEQPNLLALNSTIEAARAGESGRGFAVVAAEVKELASQTAKATEEIAGQIGHVQQATDAARRAVGTAGDVEGAAALVAESTQALEAKIDTFLKSVAA